MRVQGCLGHESDQHLAVPKLVAGVTDIRRVACGETHSAAVTATGQVYTWGRGAFGRLGHGDREDQPRPRIVEALREKRIIQIACGHGDGHTLALAGDGAVYSFGDADHGKLGRGPCVTVMVVRD